MGFRMVPRSVTLNDLDRRKGHYWPLFYRIRQLWEPIMSQWLKIDPYYLRQKCSAKNLVFSNIWFMAIFAEVTENVHYREAPARFILRWDFQHV